MALNNVGFQNDSGIYSVPSREVNNPGEDQGIGVRENNSSGEVDAGAEISARA
jgi:hypothetical protein